MTDYDIPVDETQKLADDGSPGRTWGVEATGDDVRLSTSRQYTDEGSKLSEGDRALVDVPPAAELHAYNSGSNQATVSIYPQGRNALDRDDDLKVRYLPRKSLTISGTVEANVTDKSGRDLGKARLMDKSRTLIDGSNPLPRT